MRYDVNNTHHGFKKIGQVSPFAGACTYLTYIFLHGK